MSHAMTAAGLNTTTAENIHPKGSLTSVKYCLNSFLLLVPAAQADQVATSLGDSMKAAGWAVDTTAATGTIALDRGEWVLTITHQTAGTDIDPATGKIRTGPMSFFQAKNTSFECS
ncbi:hypothetical protein [Streptacidiphilus sp. MAP12-20]|uniref:hypothetical protein n=1 Tax=Streptacidiphilus sp. MAP12-20 TaxID=3156299 RepID=UPI003517674A